MKTPVESLNDMLKEPVVIPRASEGMLILAARAPTEPDSGTEKGWLAAYKLQNPKPAKELLGTDYTQTYSRWCKARIAAWEHYKTFNWPVYWAKTIAGQLV